MAVYDPDGKCFANTLREAAHLLGVSHQTVYDASDKCANDFHLRYIPTNKRGRPQGSVTRDDGFKWKGD